MTTEDTAAPSEIAETTTIAEVAKPVETVEQVSEETEEELGEPEKAAPESGEEHAEGEEPRKPNRVSAKERISELTRQKREAETRAANAEARLKVYEAPAPKRADFTDDDTFEAERAKWAAKAARGDEAKHEAENARTEASTAKVEAWNAQRAEIAERHPDFDQVIAAVPKEIFSQSVADAILESEMAADVAYVLAKDLPRAKQFAAMTPLQQGREIGRIEAEITPKPRKLSSAPPPVETVGTKGPGSGFNAKTASVSDMAKHLGLNG